MNIQIGKPLLVMETPFSSRHRGASPQEPRQCGLYIRTKNEDGTITGGFLPCDHGSVHKEAKNVIVTKPDGHRESFEICG